MAASSTPIRAVLFDFAGTLFARADAERDVAAAAKTVGITLNAQESRELALRFEAAGVPGGPYPTSIPDAAATLYEERDLTPERHRSAYLALLSAVPAPNGLAAAVYERVLTPDGWVAYSDTYATVRALVDGGIAVALVSNTGFDLRPILRNHGLDELAAHASLSFELGVAKPAAEIFEHALTSIGAAPEQTLMVGDHETADRGAETLGVRTLILPMSPPGAEQGLVEALRLVRAGQFP